MENKELELVKAVFGNQNGDKLLAIWKNVYGDRPSYNYGNAPEQTAYFEGQRAVYLSIIQMMEIKT